MKIANIVRMKKEYIMIERVEIKEFTVFEDLKIDFVPGVNLFIGENGFSMKTER